MFYSSLEFRYFYNQEPQKLVNWFGSQEHVKIFLARTDRYLVFPNSTKAGIKFREGRFEIKSLVEIAAQLEFGTSNVPVESWEKWSSPELFSDLIQEGSEWVEVEKSRSLLTLLHGKPTEWRPDRSAACNVEISAVSIKDQTWWTFNMEAYGEDALSNLQKGWGFIQKVGLPADYFSDKFRMSYPEWLHSMNR